MKEITYNDKTYKIPKPFEECYFGKNPTEEHTITNPYSNQSTTIPAYIHRGTRSNPEKDKSADIKTLNIKRGPTALHYIA